MFNVKSISAITLAFTTCVLASHASAQTSPQTLETAQPLLSQSSSPGISTETQRSATPMETSSVESSSGEISSAATARKVTRVVAPLPVQASATLPALKNVYGQKINAKASETPEQTRFIYSQREDDTETPVYFSEKANKSR